MHFTIQREALLKPLQLVAGVVERRQTLPVLSNVLLVVEGQQLSLTGTDLEVELVGRVVLEDAAEPGEITVPARKLMDICKSLPNDVLIDIRVEEQKLLVKAGRSRFTLSTLPANDFPTVEEGPGSLNFSIAQSKLRRLIDRTSFAMAQQDVRYYLNGMLLEVNGGTLRSVATDGHRLAMCSLDAQIPSQDRHQVIVPRKGILELARLLTEQDGEVGIVLGQHHIRATTGEFTFTSKLVDGKFPDYERVLPRGGDKLVVGDRQQLREAFSRTAILSNEKVPRHSPAAFQRFAENPGEQPGAGRGRGRSAGRVQRRQPGDRLQRQLPARRAGCDRYRAGPLHPFRFQQQRPGPRGRQ